MSGGGTREHAPAPDDSENPVVFQTNSTLIEHEPEMTKTFDIYFDFEKLLLFFNSFDFDIGFDVQK